MNERIQELADQARTYARDYVAECKHYGYYMEDYELEVRFEKKFAKLILSECLELFEAAKVNQEDDVDYGLEEAKNIIKEHFGVEE